MAAGRPGTAPRWKVASSSGSEAKLGPFGVHAGNPFFPNFDNTYLSLAATRAYGDVVAFRAKAPTFVHSRHATRMGTGQLRYWSFCTNDQYSTRYVACIPDQGESSTRPATSPSSCRTPPTGRAT